MIRKGRLDESAFSFLISFSSPTFDQLLIRSVLLNRTTPPVEAGVCMPGILSQIKGWLSAIFLWLVMPFAAIAQFYDCEEELFARKDKATRLYGYVNAIGEYRVPPTFVKAFPFVGKTAVVQQGKMFGVLNCDGRLVVPADYEQIMGFSNGKGWVRKNGLWGLSDDKGRLLIQPMYEEIKEVNPTSGTVSWVKKGGLWGLISKENGRFLVPGKYEDVSNLSDSAGVGRINGRQDVVYYGDGRVIIQNMREFRRLQGELYAYQDDNHKWGAVNSLAFILIRPRWDTLFLNSPLVQVKSAGTFGLVTLRGNEILSPDFQEITPFQNGYAAVRKNGQAGVVNPSGKWEAEGLVYEKATVNGPEATAVLVKSGKAGLWSLREKKWIFPVEYQAIVHAGRWLLLTQNQKVKAYDLAGKRFSPLEWDSVSRLTKDGAGIGFKEGKFWWTRFGFDDGKQGPFDRITPSANGFSIPCSGGKCGILDPNGRLVLPLGPESVAATPSGKLFRVTANGRKGMVDVNGKSILPITYEEAWPTFTGKIWLLKTEGKWGIGDEKGNWLLEARYDSIVGQRQENEEFKAPFLAYRKGKSQVINDKGASVTELETGQWHDLGEGRLSLQKQNSVQLFGYDGKPQGNQEFEALSPFSEGNAPARLSGKWGFVNLFGKLVIPAQYEEVLPYKNGIAYARQHGKWGVLKRNGSWLVKPVGSAVAEDGTGKRKLVMP